ncbi:hypothetical protein ACFL29_02145 [Patescibacteria group bacterium]
MWITLMFLVIGLMVACLGSLGCASVQKQCVVYVGPTGLTETIRVAMMPGCEDDPHACIKQAIEETLAAADVPKPNTLKVFVQRGSLTEVQSTSNEVIELQLGVRNVADVEVNLNWQLISRSALKRAREELAKMSPY